MNLKLISQLGLTVERGLSGYTVDAQALSDILERAPRCYGYQCPGNGEIYWGDKSLEDTHTALLVGVQPIKKETKIPELTETDRKIISDLAEISKGFMALKNWLERL